MIGADRAIKRVVAQMVVVCGDIRRAEGGRELAAAARAVNATRARQFARMRAVHLSFSQNLRYGFGLIGACEATKAVGIFIGKT